MPGDSDIPVQFVSPEDFRGLAALHGWQDRTVDLLLRADRISVPTLGRDGRLVRVPVMARWKGPVCLGEREHRRRVVIAYPEPT